MRPITVTVGPVTNPGTATSIANAQGAPLAGQLLLAPAPPGGASTNTYQGNCSVVGDLLTVVTTTSGALTVGARLVGNGLPPNCVIVGPEPDVPGNWVINPPATAPLSSRQVPVQTSFLPRMKLRIPLSSTSATKAVIFSFLPWSLGSSMSL